MVIAHKIRSLKSFAALLNKAKKIVCGIQPVEEHSATLLQMGFSKGLPEGESLLPASSFGPTCRKNSEGWTEVHKDRPMETCYAPIIWRWKEWGGREREEMRFRPYKRYPRTEHPPLGIDLVIRLKTDGSKVAVLDFISEIQDNQQRIIDCINLLVEIFGECHLFTENLDSIIQGEIKRLNWRILPLGVRQWDKLKEELRPILAHQPKGTREVIENRLETINHFAPPFVAIGEGGFLGYIVFEFPKKNMYVLESAYFGNATYILGENWEHLSRLSKLELLSQNLHKARIVHRQGWHAEVTKVLS